MDLGECPKIHDLALRADYQAAANSKDYFYDVEVSLDSSRLFIRDFSSSKASFSSIKKLSMLKMKFSGNILSLFHFSGHGPLERVYPRLRPPHGVGKKEISGNAGRAFG